MKGFIPQLAEALYEKYGDEISSLHILLPSKRARLFFAEAVSRIAGKPVWQPHYLSIDDVMSEIGGAGKGDQIRLVTELYRVYSCYHTETFDSFYFWGETLLSDFDSVDKYMVDADMLFANISDLRELESDTSYLTPEQVSIISRFWKSLGSEAEYSAEKRRFMEIWRSLGPIYRLYRERLGELGIAYTGMAHRAAAEKIKSGGAEAAVPGRRYVIAGFNALTECEKTLFDFLDRNYEVEFFWDYDDYYVGDAEQEAGLFLRENIRRFPQRTELPGRHDSFSWPKEIAVVAAPSDSMQCKYAGRFLDDVAARQGGNIGKETAVVLTDENLLAPVLHAVPPAVGEINVTMGYPVRNTLEYSFTERLIELQARKREKNGGTVFYHSDVSGLLTHPFMLEACGDSALERNREIVAKQRVFVPAAMAGTDGLAGKIFRGVSGWEAMADYLTDVLSEIGRRPSPPGDKGQRAEYISLLTESIAKLGNSLRECGIEITERVFASLLRRVLQKLTVPYEGEPLAGVQVMGILETRTLDFENVVILSMNDDTFPGNRVSPSFIPYNLRVAYGLPTPAHHEGVFAYYFYRLLQRAGKVHMVYCSRSDEKSTGEQSRYVYQLDYESPHEVQKKEIYVDAGISSDHGITVEKDAEAMAKLREFTAEGGRRLSPTALYNYIQCPLKFYFRSVARLRREDELAEEVDSPMFGTILHRAMELLYGNIAGQHSPQEAIRELVGSAAVDDAVRRAINEEYLKDGAATDDDYGGNLVLVRDIVVKYINRCILPYDAGQSGFEITELEKALDVEFGFGTDSGSIHLTGKADRIDSLDGGLLRVVDYKTGAAHVEFGDVASLFEPQTHKNVSGPVLQTLIYSMMLSRLTGKDVQPALYYIRDMRSDGYSPLLHDKGRGVRVERYSDYKEEFERRLGDTFAQIMSPSVPFTQCDDAKICQYCDFREICRR